MTSDRADFFTTYVATPVRWLVSFVTKWGIIAILMAGLVVVANAALRPPRIVIQVASVPDSLTQVGYSAEVVTNRLREHTIELTQHAQSNLKSNACAIPPIRETRSVGQPAWSFDASDSDVASLSNKDLRQALPPGVGWSLEAVVTALRAGLGFEDTRLFGDVTGANGVYVLQLASGQRLLAPQRTAKIDDMEKVLAAGAAAGLEETSPFALVMAVCDERQPESVAKAIEIANKIIADERRTNKEIALAYQVKIFLMMRGQDPRSYQAAVEASKKAVSLFPKIGAFHHNLGYASRNLVIASRGGDSDSLKLALREFAVAAELEPDDPSSFYWRCRTQWEADLLTDAEHDCMRAIEISRRVGASPDDIARTHVLLGQILQGESGLQRTKAAIENLTTALQLYSSAAPAKDIGVAHANLAYAFDMLALLSGSRSCPVPVALHCIEAKRKFDEVVAVDPGEESLYDIDTFKRSSACRSAILHPGSSTPTLPTSALLGGV